MAQRNDTVPVTMAETTLHASVFVDRLGHHPIVTRSQQATDAVIRERMRYVETCCCMIVQESST